MIHLLKYRFLQVIRKTSDMFWALAFPLILATLFYFSFGNTGLSGVGDSDWEAIDTAVVIEDTSSENARTFWQFLKQMDGDTINIKKSTPSRAEKDLKNDTVQGIYYVQKIPSLTVKGNGVNESILTSLLNSYHQNFAMLQDIAATHPEKLSSALKMLSDYKPVIKEESLGGTTLDPNVQYFFALIAFACLSGIYLGVRSSFDTQADLSPLGTRRSITPTHHFTLIMVDMLILCLIHFFNILVLNLYIVKVLGISLGNNIPALLLVDFMGSVIGICLGLAFGCISKLSIGIKMSISVGITLFPAFLAGLMLGNIKNIIELHCPIINRINPAAVISDAFYCMGVYNDTLRFYRCIITLAVMSIFMLFIAFLGIRRNCYDSI